MPKLILLVFALPFVLVALVLVAPFVCLYLLFDRLCDCIEEFKPGRKKKQPNRAAQLGRVLSQFSKRGQTTTNHNQGRQDKS